jgi:serine/threonine protein kinase
MTDHIGQELGHYRLIRKLGSGSFADVYQAEHIYLNTPAAVKLLKNLASGDMQNFHDEARTIARLVHPHIVRVLDFGVEQSIPYLVMEYAPNGTLRQRHPRGVQISLPLVVTYVRQIASALQYAHTYRLIHRDVKPENLLLGRNNEILLGDFGAALITRTSLMLSTQNIIGTISYMAPEQLQGKPSPASDQYSLGIVAYEWLCGSCPFQGSLAELHHLQLYAHPPSLRAKRPTLSPITEQVVMKALSKKPEQRFATIEAFAEALEQSNRHVAPPPLFLPGYGSMHNHAASLVTEAMLAPSPLPPTMAVSLPATPLPETIIANAPLSARPRLSRRVFLGSLVGVATISGAGILALVLKAQKQPHIHSASIPTHTPTPTPVPTKSNALVTYTGHQNEVFSAVWSPDNSAIASAGGDACNLNSSTCKRQGDTGIHIWRTSTGKDVFLPYQGPGYSKLVRMVAWSSDNRIASASEDGTVEVWDATTGNNPFIYGSHRDQVCAVAWSPDSAYIASAGGNILAEQGGSQQGDTSVHIWIPSTTKDVTYADHAYLVKTIAWSPDGKLIASADIHGIVNIWDPITLTTKHVLHHTAEVGSLAWSPDSQYIVTGDYNSDDSVRIWDINAESHVQLFPQPHDDQVYTVAWSPDGQHIAAGYQSGEVKVWRYDSRGHTGTQILTYLGHSKPVMSVQWSYDSQRIASGGFDKTVQIWTIS